MLKALVDQGMMGRKSGKGCFEYTKAGGSKTGSVNPAMTEILEKFSIPAVAQNTHERIQYRLFSRFVNEAVLCLQEGILVNGPAEGDIGAIFGLGFPPHLGGESSLSAVLNCTPMVHKSTIYYPRCAEKNTV